MSMTKEQILEEAQKLSPEEQLELLKDLEETLSDEIHEPHKAAWVKVIEERAKNYVPGESPSHSWEEIEQLLEGAENESAKASN